MHTIKHLVVIALLAFLTTACGGGGGGGGGSEASPQSNTSQSPASTTGSTGQATPLTSSADSSANTAEAEPTEATETTTYTAVKSMAVKGPLTDAIASIYLIDTNNDGFKGQLAAEGFTDGDAQLVMDIDNSFLTESFFILEYTLGQELNGSTPVIPTLRTLVSSEQLNNGTAVYATPLTTLAIDNAIEGLLQSSGTDISVSEFVAAVNASATVTKQATGLGILGSDLNIFTTAPILSDNTDQEQSLAYRTTIEVFAARADNVKTESEQQGSTIEPETLVPLFAKDMLDGDLDGENNGQPINELAALDNNELRAILNEDPANLKIPGTEIAISDLNDVLASEAQQVAPEVTPRPLAKLFAATDASGDEVVTASTTVTDTAQEQTETESAASTDQQSTHTESQPSSANSPPAPQQQATVSEQQNSGSEQNSTEQQSQIEQEVVEQQTQTEQPEQEVTQEEVTEEAEPFSTSVTLSWSIPTTRLNGDPLTIAELAGYEIYYYLEGDDSNGDIITINDGSATSQDIILTAPGTYNFAIATIDADGLESEISSPISLLVE
ncbi:fibronectin type III domain-containing protein [Oceanicoccus sagamiensis]|uniref:Fibronectin type-III domain-containing protein n=1 Tax=Oceanicoccus sagamiensis TaxID=716816 RepID=A0A1X9ND76_9GAMM|nr:fibronectin type III domain-containing protein [Oceanicoccus sagamiensis]ARN75004.1 hypothetical protein BST96_13300 [Oceanicoccus sagamiensis]